MAVNTPVIKNKKAFHDYVILERFEAGIVLQGTEVKSIREGRVILKDSYAIIAGGELWLENCHISPYTHGNRMNHDPMRRRKLLLNRREINKLTGEITKTGRTIVPLKMYFVRGKVKIEIAVAKGKQLFDKRDHARRKTVEREIEIELKRR
jgi:SsrA-binding protein